MLLCFLAPGDIMGSSINGIEKLLRMPYGCGEQNMINFAPSMFIRAYLETVDQLTSSIREKSVRYMTSGRDFYRHYMTCECRKAQIRRNIRFIFRLSKGIVISTFRWLLQCFRWKTRYNKTRKLMVRVFLTSTVVHGGTFLVFNIPSLPHDLTLYELASLDN